MQFSTIIAGVMKWGAWGGRFSLSDYDHMIRQALDAGVSSFDHADIYGDYTTEAEFGAVMGRFPELRQRMQLITKCGIRMVSAQRPQHALKSYDTSFQHITTSVERSLKNLQTDYLDALLIHRPDVLMHPDEVARAFDALKASGKVLHFGVSNFTPAQVRMLHSRFPVEMHQIECSAFYLDPFLNGVLDQCLELNILPMAWGPLGSGRLSDATPDEQTSRIRSVTETLAIQYATTPDNLLLNWLLQHPSGILPVIGTSKTDRVIHAAKSPHIQMVREDWYRIWTAATGTEVP